MSEYVCVKDGRILRIAKNGVYAELLDDAGEPYKIYSTDVWTCPKCGYVLMVTAPNQVAEHWQSEDYNRFKKRVTVTFQH